MVDSGTPSLRMGQVRHNCLKTYQLLLSLPVQVVCGGEEEPSLQFNSCASPQDQIRVLQVPDMVGGVSKPLRVLLQSK